MDQLGARLDDPLLFAGPPHHEPVDVVEEEDGQPVLIAVDHEPGCLLGAVHVQDAPKLDRACGRSHLVVLVGHDSHRKALDPGRATHDRLAVLGLVLGKRSPIHDAVQHVADFIVDPRIGADQVVQIRSRAAGRLGLPTAVGGHGHGRIGGFQPHQLADPLQTTLVVRLAIVDRAADPRVHLGPPQLFVRHLLPNGALHQRRTGQVQPRSFGHQGLVAQHGQVPAARHAVAHDRGQLGDPGGRQHGVVAEDASKIVFVRKHVFLQRQEHPRRIDQVDQREAINQRDPLSSQQLLGRGWKEGARLDRGVVGCDQVSLASDGS